MSANKSSSGSDNHQENDPDLPPWQYRGHPALVAHRGFARLFPENTLTALAAAVDAGARFVEFDLQLSTDHVPFLMHDDNLKRTAGLNQSVFDLAMAKIKSIGVGEAERFNGRYRDTYPITLRDMCDHLNNWPNVHSFVEIKTESVEHFGLELVMQKIISELDNLTSPFSVISFREDVVRYVKAHTNMSAGWVIRHWNKDSLDTLENMQPEFVYCNYKIIPEMKTVPQGSWSWVLYEITEPHIAAHWRQRGIDMIETMHVSSMLNSTVFSNEQNI